MIGDNSQKIRMKENITTRLGLARLAFQILDSNRIRTCSRRWKDWTLRIQNIMRILVRGRRRISKRWRSGKALIFSGHTTQCQTAGSTCVDPVSRNLLERSIERRISITLCNCSLKQRSTARLCCLDSTRLQRPLNRKYTVRAQIIPSTRAVAAKPTYQVRC